MALNLKKLASKSVAEGETRPGADEPRNLYGSRGEPPPPGSSYDKFLDWACEGALEPLPEDLALAMDLWLGRHEVSGPRIPGR